MFNFIPNRLALIVLVSACSIILISMGLRQTFGLFFEDFEKGLGATRTEFGLAIGIQMLFWGAFAPIFGLIADKLGGNKAVFIGFIIFGLGVYMLYAGPREALLHAVFRQNCGCSYLIVGRDHAGVGDFYGAFDAQDIFGSVPKDALLIKIFKADHTAYSKKLNEVVMMRDAKDHTKDDFVLLSGTKVREMLAAGQELPPEFARREVAEILMTYYQQKGW